MLSRRSLDPGIRVLMNSQYSRVRQFRMLVGHHRWRFIRPISHSCDFSELLHLIILAAATCSGPVMHRIRVTLNRMFSVALKPVCRLIRVVFVTCHVALCGAPL